MDYDQAVKMINGLESPLAEEPKVATFSMKDVFDDTASIKEYDSRTEAQIIMKTINIVNTIDSRGAGAAMPSPQAQAEKRQKEQQVTVRVGGQLGSSMKQFAEKETAAAAKELHTVVNSIDNATPQHTANIAPPAEKLILPTLSLQDQISELEKLSIGIDVHIFEKDQLDIAMLEAKGLKDSIKSETLPTDDFQKNLVNMRNNRLDEVINKLKMHK